MTTSLPNILESKRALRGELAARPVGEKLRMLEEMREREMAIRAGVRPVDQRVRFEARWKSPAR